MGKRISSVKGLIAVARGNQDIFKQLKKAETHFKQSVIERYLENNRKYLKNASSKSADTETILTKAMQVYTYDLELLSVSFPLKRFRLKNKLIEYKNEFQEEAKKTVFTINATQTSKRNLKIQFEHYKNDLTEDVVEEITEYVKCHLQKIPSFWDLIVSFCTRILRYGKEFHDSKKESLN